MTIRAYLQNLPQIHASVLVDEQALVVGDVVIGEDSSVWPMAVLRGDVQRIEIGARSNIQDGSVLHVTHDSEYTPGGRPLIIGDDVTVGHAVMLHACTLEDCCLIGIGAIVLDGAVVKSGAMLAAGSLVPPGKIIEGGYLWMGSPVKKLRPLSDKERAYLEYSAAHYVRVARQHKLGS